MICHVWADTVIRVGDQQNLAPLSSANSFGNSGNRPLYDFFRYLRKGSFFIFIFFYTDIEFRPRFTAPIDF